MEQESESRGGTSNLETASHLQGDITMTPAYPGLLTSGTSLRTSADLVSELSVHECLIDAVMSFTALQLWLANRSG